MKLLRIMATLLAGSILTAHADPVKITVQTDKPGARINPNFYGLMTEEINHAFDGGLYAELIRNRSFRDDAKTPAHWSLVQDNGGQGSIGLDAGTPFNAATKTTLKLEITSGSGRVGVANDGFWGIGVRPETTYQATFYAKTTGAPGPLTVDLETADGRTVHATASVGEAGPEWKKYTASLTTPAGLVPSAANRFVISAARPGTVWLGYVSLFPPTYKNRANGNRIDLMEKLAAMKPGFLRFPGGNYVDPGHYQWKKTLGPVEGRPGSPGAWKYQISEGLGLLEFFEWCEDLNMEPLLAVSNGRSEPTAAVAPVPAPFVQDALDEIEYATGGPETVWGARRVADGHPAPFKLRYVEVGNEDGFDKSGTYEKAFALFFDAIRAKYPALKIISTRGDIKSRVPDIIDDHIYASSVQMQRAAHHYDKHPRGGPQIFVGEWATNGDGVPTATLRAALGDAAYLTGLERNADLITMACYAPLFVNVNPGARQWPTNLIGYDALTSFGSPSHAMQVMFSANKGDVVLPVDVSGTGVAGVSEPASGRVGVGTWDTQAEFKDMRLTRGETTLLAPELDAGRMGWRAGPGTWKKSEDGTLVQSGDAKPAYDMAGELGWTDYTLKLKARKTGGSEGFLILFHAQDGANQTWWNLGGWGNARSGLEQTVGNERHALGKPQEITIETGRWYDIEIDVKGRQVRCSLDGKLVAEETLPEPPPPPARVFASASRDEAAGDVILKVVNVDAAPQPVQFELPGADTIGATASGQVLTGAPEAVNTVAEPEKIAPQPLTITGAGKSFLHEFPAHSVSVFRLKTR